MHLAMVARKLVIWEGMGRKEERKEGRKEGGNGRDGKEGRKEGME